MKYLFILLLGLGFCEEIQGQSEIYTINYKSGFDRLSLDNLQFIDATKESITFQGPDGEKYQINRSSIILILDSNGNEISVYSFSYTYKLDTSPTYIHPSIKNSPLPSSGDELINSGKLMLIGDLLPIVGLIHYTITLEPTILCIAGISGFIIKLYSYKKLMDAGKKINRQLPS